MHPNTKPKTQSFPNVSLSLLSLTWQKMSMFQILQPFLYAVSFFSISSGWQSEKEGERCHFSHSAVMVRHINWLSLKTHTCTDTMSHLCSPASWNLPISSLFHSYTARVIFTWKLIFENNNTCHTHQGCHQMWHVHGPLNER